MYLFDYSKHPPHPKQEEIQPQMILSGQQDVGFAIDWNLNKSGILLSGSNKGDCCIWDIEKTPTKKPVNGKNNYILIN